MRNVKKWFAILLGVLMALGQVAGALADVPDAVSIIEASLGGRDVSYALTAEWNSPMIIDEETNAMLVALFDAMEIKGRSAVVDESSYYSDYELLISGESAISMSAYADEEGVYLSSPMFGNDIAITQDELKSYLMNMGRYMDKIYADEDTSIEAMYETLYDTVMGYADAEIDITAQTEAIEETIEGFTGIATAAQEWIADAIKPEAIEGDTGSELGIAHNAATAITITKADMVDYFEAITPVILETDVYWELVSGIYNMAKDESDPDVTIDEMKENASTIEQGMMDAVNNLPEDTQITIYACTDDKDETVLVKISCEATAEDEYGDDFWLYLECVPNGMPLYGELLLGMDGATLTIVDKEGEDEGFTATMDIISYGDVDGQVIMDVSSIVTEENGDRVWDGAFNLTVAEVSEQQGMEMGFALTAHQVDHVEGGDVSKAADVEMSMNYMGVPLPLMTLHATVETGEQQGPSFTVDKAAVHPGAMDEEAFEAYMNEDLIPSTMKAMIRMMSMLPNEVYTMMIESAEYGY